MLATTVAVGSHALLDVLGAGGRGLPLLWPFSEARFISPVRIFPDAPRGLALLSWPGMTNVAIEFAVFLPVMVFAAWPRIAGWLSARGLIRRIPTLPSLTFIEGGVEAAPPARRPPRRRRRRPRRPFPTNAIPRCARPGSDASASSSFRPFFGYRSRKIG